MQVEACFGRGMNPEHVLIALNAFTLTNEDTEPNELVVNYYGKYLRILG
jgi:hypothetical protein